MFVPYVLCIVTAAMLVSWHGRQIQDNLRMNHPNIG